MIYPCFKRLIDILAGGLAVVAWSPIWLLTALAIKLTSPGPIFYGQARGGRDSKPFNLLKFRSMRTDHVHDPNEMYVGLSHPAITPVGRFIRRTKIDESIQFVHVLSGKMSLIGPRPTIMDQVVAYDDFQRQRQKVRPGLTGLAQINGGASIPWEERIKYDVYYVNHLSPTLDLYILLKTFPVVLFGEKKYVRPFEQSPYSQATSA